jgi:fibronectin-binding autotransporter adhesin
VNIATVSGAKLLVSASETIGSLSGGNGASGEVALGANTLTLGDATETTYAGTISGTATTGTLIKAGTGTLNLAASSLLPFDNLTANDGTLNLNAILGTGSGTAVVTVNDTPGGVATKLQLGSVSQTLSSLTIGEGATVVFTSGVATGAFSTASGKAGTFGPVTTNFGPSASLVPEPGTIGLLLIGALGTLHRRQRPTNRLN